MEFKSFKQNFEKKTIINSVNENQIDQILMNHPISPHEIFYFQKKFKSNSSGPDN